MDKKYSMHEENEDSGIFSFASTAESCDLGVSRPTSMEVNNQGQNGFSSSYSSAALTSDISLEVNRSLALLDQMCLSTSTSSSVAKLEPLPTQNEDGDTDLHLSIIMGASEEDIKFKLSSAHKSIVNTANNRRQSCLYLAVLTNRSTALVSHMISSGADISLPDHRGNTPFHVACRNGNIDLLNTLVSSTSDPSQLLYQRNYEGQTCLHIAAEHRQLRVVQFLNHKMDINAQEGLCGKTILHQCVDRVMGGECSLFLKALLYIREIDVNARTFGDLRALDLSKGNALLTSIFSVYKQCDDSKSIAHSDNEDCDLDTDIMMDYDDFQIAGQTIVI